MSAASADSLRDWVSLLVTEKAPQAGLHQEGRPVLITGTTLLGLGFYGWAVPYAGHVEDGGVATGLYLLTAAGSFFIPFALTADQDVTYGMADLTLYGTTRGIVHGILAYQLFAGSDNTSQGNVGSAAAGSLIEGVGGYLWAQRAHLTAGAVQTVGTLGDFGLLEGLGFASLADDYDNDRNSAAAAKMLAGSAAGLAGGAVLAQHRDFSYGDAAVMRDAGLLGVLGADMVADWFNPSDHQAYVGAAMAGGALGLAAGDRLVARTDFNVGQSVLVTLGMVAGGMVGLGISAIGLSDSGDHSTFALTASMAGATLGFAATYASLLPQARSGSADHSSWRIELSPVAALAGARRPGPSRNAVADAPLVRVSCRF
jgi:hypothetical protein